MSYNNSWITKRNMSDPGKINQKRPRHYHVGDCDGQQDRLTTWRKITIPLLLPAIFASAVLIFPWSFNDFTITYFVAGVGTTTLPLYLYSMLQYSLKPVLINAISLIFIITPTIGILVISYLQREKQI